MADTKAYKTKEEKSVLVANAIIRDLSSRKGFDEVFPLISPEVLVDLTTTIATIVKGGM